jgi:hypothetical protein
VVEGAYLFYSISAGAPGGSRLLDFLVGLVLPAVLAELLHLQTLGRGLLILGRRIVPVLAFRTLERDDVARHCFSAPDTGQASGPLVTS